MVDQRKNLMINYIPPDMEEDELDRLFSPFGEIREKKIVRDIVTKLSFGYGFVEFSKHTSALAAQFCMNGYSIRGKLLKVDFARPRGTEIMNANLIVTFLPLNVDEDQLKTLFGEHGDIIEVKILRDKETGQSLGRGYVRFDLNSSAKNARIALNFHCFEGNPTPISVHFKRRRESRMQAPREVENPSVGAPVPSPYVFNPDSD